MPIRQYRPPTSEFIEEFQDTVIPSAIPSSEFIDWDNIEYQIDNYTNQINALSNLENTSEQEFISGLTDALMEADNTRKWLDFYFEVLGERGWKYSSLEGVWKLREVQKQIDEGNREIANDTADILQEMGLQYVVDNADIRDHYRGMLVGMETHSRKNRQGTMFEELVEEELQKVVTSLRDNGHNVLLETEYTTEYNDESGQSKKVDFALLENDKLRLVVEANCYKGGGSKPSEIRRSYNRVANRMRNDDVAFIWITDGQGWVKSLTNVLKQSYNDITDIYNLHQAKQELEDDILNFFETREV